MSRRRGDGSSGANRCKHRVFARGSRPSVQRLQLVDAEFGCWRERTLLRDGARCVCMSPITLYQHMFFSPRIHFGVRTRRATRSSLCRTSRQLLGPLRSPPRATECGLADVAWTVVPNAGSGELSVHDGRACSATDRAGLHIGPPQPQPGTGQHRCL